jgi:hypothetical protein
MMATVAAMFVSVPTIVSLDQRREIRAFVELGCVLFIGFVVRVIHSMISDA